MDRYTAMSRLLILLGLIGCTWGLFGCVGPDLPAPPPQPEAAAPDFDEAMEAGQRLEAAESVFAQGRLQEADLAFTDFLRRFADQPGADLAWLRSGQIKLTQHNPEAARKAFETVLRYPQTAHADAARLGLAQAELALAKPFAALAALAEIEQPNLSPADLSRCYQAQAQARFQMGQPKAALLALILGWRESPKEQKPAFINLLTEFIAAWPVDLLEELAPLYAADFPGAYLLEGLARKYHHAQDFKRAREVEEQLKKRFPGHRLEAGERAAPAPSYTIGCLLPLTGPLAAHGARFLEGMQLAAGVFEAASPFELVIEDTANEIEVTVAALDRLADQTETIAVIGPLSGQLCLGAAVKAEELEIPLITLTQRREVAGVGSWVFRDFITPDILIEALARRAVQDLGLTRVAVLHPESAYGRRMLTLMAEQVSLNGGELTYVVTYPPKSPDLADQLLRLGGQEPSLTPREWPLDFDALFLPDDYFEVAQIAPQLAFYDLNDVVLLGTNLWHDPELIALSAPYVQGAIIPTVYFPDSDDPRMREFVARFQESYGYPPDVFAALGYDAVRLVIDVLQGLAVKNRTNLRDGLLAVEDYPGLTGLTRINEQGEAIKEPYLLTVEGESFVLAPESLFLAE
ncbi:MAG: penicillin-binding protein activator [Deltaproteobacteria bacterium]|nr:penicillin-binding protein activator [Deltaproteobacteria bacterium]